MANEDRIKAWREQRRAGILPTDPHGTALSQTLVRTTALVGDASVKVEDILQVAVDGLSAFPNADASQRRGVYDRMSEGVQAAVKEKQIASALADYWMRRVQTVIRMLENAIRKDVDVFAEGYIPAGLQEADDNLLKRRRALIQRERADKLREARRQATRDDVAHTIPLQAPGSHTLVVADLDRLRPILFHLHATQRQTGPGPIPKFLTIGPLFLLRINTIQADSRIALLWSFLGPITMVTIISAMYVITGTHFILGMDVATFTLVGMVNWIMFRIIVFRSSESYFGGRPFLNLEPVTPLVMALANSVFYFGVYVVLLFTMVVVGHAIGLVSLPDNILGVLLCMFGVAVIAASFGLLFASIASRWEFFMRLAPPIERFLQLFSSVFFISEQLPVQWRGFVLWWPLSHGLQLLRSAYFPSYKSHDASPTYFVAAVIIFFAAGLLADRLAKSNVQPM